MNITLEEIIGLVKESIENVYANDYYLIKFEPEKKDCCNDNKHHVGERSIVFRFAYYLQKIIEGNDRFLGLSLDCEYNRNKTNPKDLPSFPNGTYPDVIIHERGSNKKNVLVMEFKTYWNRTQKDDIKKIKEFTTKEGKYLFNYGITVLIMEKSAEMQIFVDGKNIDTLTFRYLNIKSEEKL